MTVLAQSIRREILMHGSISFARFMELALYSPEGGYYETSAQKIGRKGDFYTSVSVGAFFAELLCWQFVQWLSNVDSNCVQITESGAHDGRFAADVLNLMSQNQPEIYDRVEYWIVEPSASREALQRTVLRFFQDKVRWFRTISNLPESGVHGVFFSNELLDAFPVHRLGWDAQRHAWFEWRVALSGNDVTWERQPIARDEIDNLVPALPAALLKALSHEYTVEVSPAARDWWRQAARALRAGRLVAIDYGFTIEELIRSGRISGTLRAYRKHHISNDVLKHPGEKDITAHVNFSDLMETGGREGLKTEELTDQSRFLSRILQDGLRQSAVKLDPNRVRQFQTLTHPDHMGHSFKVLVQSRR